MRYALGTLLAVSLLTPWPAPPQAHAAAVLARYEAEGAMISGGVVESNWPGSSGTGFVNGTNASGAYVEFTVSVDATGAGPATIAVRYANGTDADRAADIAVNGVNRRVSFPSTGDWATWATATLTATLNAGANTIRVTAATAEGNANLDCLDVTPSAAADYQAEDATISQGVVESNHAGFTGTGFVNLDNVVGSYVEFAVTGPAATVAIRYANGTTTNRPMNVNGTSVDFPGTGAWTTWAVATVPVNLAAGTHQVRLTSTTADGGPNLDRLTVGPPDSEAPTVPGNPSVTGTTGTSISLAWTAPTDNVGVAAYRVYEGSTIVATPTGVTATVGGLAPSSTHTYTIRLVLMGLLLASCSAPAAQPAKAPQPAERTETQLSATLDTPTRITLRWTGHDPDLAGRVVEFATDPGGTYTILAFVPPGQNTYTHSELIPHTTFHYRVRPYYGPPSGELIRLTWPDNSADEDGYLLECQPVGGDGFRVIAMLDPGTTSFDVLPEPQERDGRFRVRAFRFGQASNVAHRMTGAG